MMQRKRLLMVLLALFAQALPGMPPPFLVECRQLDLVYKAVNADSPASQTAFEVLKLVALGQADGIDDGQRTRVGLKPEQLKGAAFKNPNVRMYAFERIGAPGLPEALDFLENLEEDDVGTDAVHQVWPVAQIALRQSHLNRISDPQARRAFFEKTVTELHDPISRDGVVTWAVDQLCDSGAFASLPLIRESIRKRDSGPRSEVRIQYCEALMDVVARDPDRIKAIATVLRVNNASYDRKLALWAVYQLNSMNSPKADAELKRFAGEIAALPETSPQKRELGFFDKYIQSLFLRRPRE